MRQVAKEKYAHAVWLKLETLYMTKSSANRLFMKQRLYSFKIKEDSVTSDQIDEFIKIIDDLKNLGIKLDEEDKTLFLFNALPKSYENFRDAMLYGREQSISLEEVQSAIHSTKLQRKNLEKGPSQGEGLTVPGKPGKEDLRYNKNKPVSKVMTKFKCFECHKEGHYKRDCPERKMKVHFKPKERGDAAVAS